MPLSATHGPDMGASADLGWTPGGRAWSHGSYPLPSGTTPPFINFAEEPASFTPVGRIDGRPGARTGAAASSRRGLRGCRNHDEGSFSLSYGRHAGKAISARK